MSTAAGSRFLAALCLTGVLLGSVSLAHASEENEGQTLRWNPQWPKFGPAEYIVTGIAGPVAIGMFNVLMPQRDPHWVGGILFDDAARDALRLRSPAGLKTVRFLADVTAVASVGLVVGLDSVLVPILRNSGDVAIQLTLMDVEAFSMSSIVTFALYDSVGRGRPSYLDCQRDGSADAQCIDSPTASFPSGHTNEAFTAAGLSCAHHTRLPLYGSKLADTLACARDLTLATADGVLRIMGDRHYATDVLTGAALGLGFGYGLPTFLHYARVREPLAGLTLAPMKGSLVGISAVGEF